MAANSQPTHIVRPQADEAGWEYWALPSQQGGVPERAADLPRKAPFVLAPPTRTMLARPLWIASDADPIEMARLDFESRHLIRKGQSPVTMRIATVEDRTLVFAVVPSDDEIFSGSWLDAERFEPHARLLDAGDAGLVFWREEAKICYAYFRDGQCVYFSSTGETAVFRELAFSIARCTAWLLAENVLLVPPAKVCLLGLFIESEIDNIAAVTGAEVVVIEDTSPRLPEPPMDAPAPAAVARRNRRDTNKRLVVVGIAVAAVYLALVVAFLAFYMGKSVALQRVQAQARPIALEAAESRYKVERWQAIRPAVDTDIFMLDMIADIAQLLPGDNVRLTQFNANYDRILILGEAASIDQTHKFLNGIRQSSALSMFEWNEVRQPLQVGTVYRFELQGRRPDASDQPE